MQHCHWQDYEGAWSIDFLQYAGNAIRAHQVCVACVGVGGGGCVWVWGGGRVYNKCAYTGHVGHMLKVYGCATLSLSRPAKG